MTVLALGIDETTLSFLRENGVSIEILDPEYTDDLRDWLSDNRYTALIADIDMAGGIYLARTLRHTNIPTAIIGISRGSENRKWSDQRALFLENGGDDLLKHPVNPRELKATLSATSRRFSGSLLDIYDFTKGDIRLKVNLTTRNVTVNGTDANLTEKERAVMLQLAAAPGRTLSKEVIMSNLYSGSPDDEPEIKIIDVFVCKLRNKLNDIEDGASSFIETVWGQGYRLQTDNVAKSSQIA